MIQCTVTLDHNATEYCLKQYELVSMNRIRNANYLLPEVYPFKLLSVYHLFGCNIPFSQLSLITPAQGNAKQETL
jgi:hypothetical protein